MNTPAVLPGAPFLAWRGPKLELEGHALDALAHTHGTPLFVYSRAAMRHALASYTRALVGRRHLVCYAMKANSSLAVLQTFAQAGCGFDIVSVGELERVLAAGGEPKKIVFSGVGKRPDEMRRALEVGVKCFNVESLGELQSLSEEARAMNVKAPVSLRINPDIDPKTHPYIATGLQGSKFGIAHKEAVTAYRVAADLPGLEVVGIDCHIGSQITEAEPYLEALERLLDLIEAIEAENIGIRHLDVDGVRLDALLGLPEHARATRDGQTFIVNRRWIQSPVLSQALRQAYGNLLPAGRFPAAALWITAPRERAST